MGESSTVRVTYRSLELAPAAALDDRGGGRHFLAIDTPPPVRTVLGLARVGETKMLAVEVVEAIEIDAPGSTRGCVVREVDGALLQRPPVGSERLADGAAGASDVSGSDGAVAHEAGSFDEGYAAPMAVPSPVVGDSESSDTIDVADARGDGEDGDDSDDGSAGGDAEAGGTPAKKRRGRKRK
jgi:hypothetical protein